MGKKTTTAKSGTTKSVKKIAVKKSVATGETKLVPLWTGRNEKIQRLRTGLSSANPEFTKKVTEKQHALLKKHLLLETLITLANKKNVVTAAVSRDAAMLIGGMKRVV